MWDRILELGATFDWISPLMALIEDLANGPSHTFLVPHPCGWSGREIEALLKGYGVRTWGLMIVDGRLMLSVRRAQARWAQYVLEREGIPIRNRFEEHQKRRPHRTPSSTDRPSLLQTIGSWLDRII